MSNKSSCSNGADKKVRCSVKACLESGKEDRMSEKLLTIIVPAYNVQNYIEQCLQSILLQTESNHCAVVINDGSTDETGTVCKRYADRYPELFRYVSIKNHGLGYVRNLGLKMVQTPYVTFLDSDDWLDFNYVEKVLRALGGYADGDIDIAYTLPTVYDALTGLYEEWSDSELFHKIFDSGERIVSPKKNARMYALEYSACRKIFYVGFLKKISFRFDCGVKWEDVFPHFYATYYAERCIGIKETGFYYRINTKNTITESSGRDRMDMVRAFEKTWRFLIHKKAGSRVCMIVFDRMVDFTWWCLAKADKETRPRLLVGIRRLFCRLPCKYQRMYMQSRAPRIKKLFVWGITKPFSAWIYTDDFLRINILRIIRKIKRIVFRGQIAQA